ncbi:MAG TPA: sulfate ABC transporter permease subunit CysT [Chloroflexota bacterium]
MLRGVVTGYLSLVVLIPLAAVMWRATNSGLESFWQAISGPGAVATLRWTFLAAIAVVVTNAVAGTCVAWVLVRDHFPGKASVNALIDLPFALPTIVAGITLITLYGPKSPFGLDAAYTRFGVILALLFVTLPFVVRAVQPVLQAVDREMEEAAASLGATPFTVFRRIVLPNLVPAVLSGTALSFARAMGEFGAVILISGGLPGTQVASMYVFSQIQSDNEIGAAAVSAVLLTVSLVMLLTISAVDRWSNRHAG